MTVRFDDVHVVGRPKETQRRYPKPLVLFGCGCMITSTTKGTVLITSRNKDWVLRTQRTVFRFFIMFD